MLISLRERALGDLIFGVVLCGSYVLGMAVPQLRYLAIAVGGVALAVFSIRECRLGIRAPTDVGLGGDELGSAFQLSALTLLPVLLGCCVYLFFHGAHHPLHFCLALLIYPLWGFVQQLLFQGIILSACRRLDWGAWSIPVTSILFVGTHYPSTFLMTATVLGAPLFSLTYYLRPKIIPLAIYHGVFGAFLYYVFRDKDILERVLR